MPASVSLALISASVIARSFARSIRPWLFRCIALGFLCLDFCSELIIEVPFAVACTSCGYDATITCSRNPNNGHVDSINQTDRELPRLAMVDVAFSLNVDIIENANRRLEVDTMLDI